MQLKFYLRLLLATLGFWAVVSGSANAQIWSNVSTSDGSAVTARHENGSVEYNGYIYAFGGRHDRPVQRFDPANNVWETVAQSPIEMHHFQPVVYDNKIYIIGAFTCCYPAEPTLPDIYIFDPADNSWTTDGTIPASRLRGSAGTLVRNNKIYLIGGNTNGHSGGAVGWFDEYDPATGSWTTLADAPTPRDHFQAILIGNKLVAVGGRQSDRSFANTIASTDVYDFANNSWSATADQIPTPRAGTMAVPYNDEVYVLGGESAEASTAHDEVEVFNPQTERWSALANMLTPRHAGGAAMIGSNLHVFAGSSTKGAAGENSNHESIDLAAASTTPLPRTPPTDTDSDQVPDADEINIHNTDPNDNDTDNDGLTDGDELYNYSTDPLDADSDSDGIDDGTEVNELNSDPLNTDSDDDDLADGDEYLIHGSSPTKADTDNDGLEDKAEIEVYLTDPVNSDTDGDFISDGDEVTTYQSNPLSKDSDADGVDDNQEIALGTSLTNSDEDGDGLENSVDGTEDSDGDGLPNYVDLDSDNDTIPDLIEAGYPDQDRNGKLDAGSSANEESPPDTDGDDIPDFLDSDSDQDGLTDYAEANSDYMQNRQRVNLEDTDNNGLDDRYGTFSLIPVDSDNDGSPNYLDLDSDNDEINDITEAGVPDADSDGKIDNFSDDDNDGLTDAFIPQLASGLPDADGDSIPDLIDNASTGSGCTIAANAGSIDPIIPALLMISVTMAYRRRSLKQVEL